jgi:acyl dehydratase
MALDLDRSIIGEEFDRTTYDPLTAEELVAFATALGETDPHYTQPGPDLVAHPTFAVRFKGKKFFPDNLPESLRFRMSFDAGKDLDVGVPVRPGDAITIVSTLHDVYEKTGRTGTMVFVVVRFTLLNQRGEQVAIVDNRLMYRGQDQ